MEITAFDTHDFVKRLTEVGMPEAQAEILAEEQSRLIKERLATKQDLKAMEVAIMELKRDIKELEDRLKRDMMELKRDLRELEDRLKRDMMGLKRDLKEAEGGLKRDLKEAEGGLKRDLKEAEGGLKRDLREAEDRLRRDLKEMEQKLTIKLGGIMVIGVSVLAVLVKLL